MVLTLELPFRQPDFFKLYVQRFGALPAWFAEISSATARRLARQAVQTGVPLTLADCSEEIV